MQPTQQQILDEALNLFIKQSYEKTSLSDISKQIGYTKLTIYYYYENKDELFLAVLTSFLDQVEQRLQNILHKEQLAQRMIYDLLTSLDRTGLIWFIKMKMEISQRILISTIIRSYLKGSRTFPKSNSD
jgi:AcrR family transcriptional regulator